jgi:predicted nucleic acid-binding protein
MRIAIKDANIFFDLAHIDLLDEFFQLELTVSTSDLVYREIKDEEQKKKIDKHKESGRFQILSLEGAEIAQLVSMQQRRKRLSLEDCSVVFLAQKHQGMVLTGDGALRKLAIAENVEVHGILWIFDELVRQNVIDCPTARTKLQKLMGLNSRLPQKECEKRLNRWQEIVEEV